MYLVQAVRNTTFAQENTTSDLRAFNTSGLEIKQMKTFNLPLPQWPKSDTLLPALEKSSEGRIYRGPKQLSSSTLVKSNTETTESSDREHIWWKVITRIYEPVRWIIRLPESCFCIDLLDSGHSRLKEVNFGTFAWIWIYGTGKGWSC